MHLMVAETAATVAVETLDWTELAARDGKKAALPKAEPDATAYLQYSSGSTRFPHGVAVSHRGLLNNLAAHSHGMQVIDTDRCISWLPWYNATIGSASCRERVCQYVSLSLAQVSLTKQKLKIPLPSQYY